MFYTRKYLLWDQTLACSTCKLLLFLPCDHRIKFKENKSVRYVVDYLKGRWEGIVKQLGVKEIRIYPRKINFEYATHQGWGVTDTHIKMSEIRRQIISSDTTNNVVDNKPSDEFFQMEYDFVYNTNPNQASFGFFNSLPTATVYSNTKNETRTEIPTSSKVPTKTASITSFADVSHLFESSMAAPPSTTILPTASNMNSPPTPSPRKRKQGKEPLTKQSPKKRKSNKKITETEIIPPLTGLQQVIVNGNSSQNLFGSLWSQTGASLAEKALNPNAEVSNISELLNFAKTDNLIVNSSSNTSAFFGSSLFGDSKPPLSEGNQSNVGIFDHSDPFGLDSTKEKSLFSALNEKTASGKSFANFAMN